jgi:ABC-2 type transport system permease protein
MTPVGRVRKLAWVETKLFARDPLTLVFTFAFPLIMLFVLAEVFGNSTADRDEIVYRNVGAIDYYVPAYVALVAAAVGIISIPVRLTSYRELGVFRRFRASGMSAWTLIAAELAVTAALTLIGTILVVALTAAAYRNRAPVDVAGVVAIWLLVTLVFAALGILLGAVLPNARAAQAVGSILFFVMLMLCGAGPPPEVLSGVLRAAADALPLTHAIRLLQDPWLGFAWEWPPLAALAGFLVGSVALALRFFRWESR